MRMKKNMPGVLLALVLAMVAMGLGQISHVMSSAVIALLLGMGVRLCLKNWKVYESGLNWTSKKLLRVGIILLGAGLSVGQILHVGKFSLFVMVFTLVAAFGGGYLFGKLFKMNWKLSSLISAGTGICGGSAIAAISPVIEADDSDVAYAISATFIFDIFMVILFPIMGRALGLSDMAYGLWAGTAVNDTSSVVAAGFAYSQAAGDFATIVKLTRTLSIIPIIIIFSLVHQRMKAKQQGKNEKFSLAQVNLKAIFPWFIVFFLIAAFMNSIGLIPIGVGNILSSLSKWFMVMSLAAIGLKTDFNKLKKAGFLPMLHGFIISLLVVVVALGAQMMIGQI